MFRFVFFLALYLNLSATLAFTTDIVTIPAPLKPWVNWVLQDEKQYQCPFFYNNFTQKKCSWPGKLSLKLYNKQAQFSSQWQVYKENWIVLPGNKSHWPQKVTVNNKPALVMNKQGKPQIKLPIGKHTIKGRFFWDKIPENLAIPKNTGLLQLTINDKNIPYPTIKRDSVWLKESDLGHKKPKNIENKLDLQVFRQVVDNVPLQLISYFELEVSGKQREITLPYALLKDFIAISLKSPLPARIEADGSLLLQVRPGRWHIELNARSPKPATQLDLAINDKQWPKSEIWSFNAMPFLRLVEISNLKTIDPSQTNIPRQWKNMPAYLIKQGERMVFKVIRRGDPDPEPNQLNLSRQLWLDFDGEAYTARDTINGKMTKGWRLNALPELQVGHVNLNGQNQLITSSIATNEQGVEVRQGRINLQADSRIKGEISQMSAVGWQQNFHQVNAELNIPPGWRLLAVSGVDNVPQSWISQWTLLDLFLVLIASLAISRLWTLYWGIFALFTLTIIWHESNSPHFIWLNILAAVALIRVLPEGVFKKILTWYRNFCWLSLIIIVIPFMVDQVRIGLYPQLEKQWKQISPAQHGRIDNVQVAAEQELFASDSSVSKMRALASPSSLPLKVKAKKQTLYDRIDPDANIQTGPGVPQWQWTKLNLSWNGSVDSQQQINFWYLSPLLTMLLNFLSVILVLILSLLMFGLINKKFQFPKTLFSWLIVVPFLTLPAQDVSADFPDQQLLDQLKTQLLKAPDCLPSCAQIATMHVSISNKNLSLKLQVHAQQAVAIPLPAKLDQWFPNTVLIDDKPAQALIRTAQQELWISLKKGQHTIELQGLNPIHNKFFLPLTLRPHRTVLKTQGWAINGIQANGQTDNQLIFSRIKTVQQIQSDKHKLQPGILPAFIRVERTLNLGLDWRVTTRIVRLFNNDSAISLAVPLLEGESITTDKIKLKDKHVLINMTPRKQSFQWQSIIKKTDQINLVAANTQQWTELWRVNASSTWHIESSGIAIVHHQDNGQWLPEWRPFPGEKVSLVITRPKAVKGATITIDNTKLLSKPGKRSLETELRLSIRSSKGAQHTLTLPDNVQLQSVRINGTTQPIRQKQSKVTLPIKPGKQDISLVWRQVKEQSLFFTTALVDIGIASVNTHLNLILGHDRWVLFTSGPKFGPAVLFWGVLIVIAAISFGLGKLSLTPLKHWHWFLLLIGLSQIPIASALCVVVWLVALGFREKKTVTDSGYFNVMQIGLGMLTLVSLLLLFVAIQHGLLGSPDMQIVGNQSSTFNLNWYQDRSNKLLPTATIISIPLMSYRILMLIWSLWLAVSLLNWLKWGWQCFSTGGLWKEMKSSKKPMLENTEEN